MTALRVEQIGPGVTLQDLGRPGYLQFGLGRGGAVDLLALAEGAALLGQNPDCAALEMPGFGGRFTALGDMRIALTGAPMVATLDGAPLQWNASHRIRVGQVLNIGAVRQGAFGYLHAGGGFALPETLGSRARHVTAGIGPRIVAGQDLPLGPDPHPGASSQRLPTAERFYGGTIRIVPGPQTRLFTKAELTRFTTTAFTRSPRGNRQGVRLDADTAPFRAKDQLTVVSQTTLPGDIQMTGDGTPFVLLADCQTTGGYPRIGTVIPADLPLVAQATLGQPLRFKIIALDQAVQTLLTPAQMTDLCRRTLTPLIRNPHDIHDLAGYQLIGGIINANDPGEAT